MHELQRLLVEDIRPFRGNAVLVGGFNSFKPDSSSSMTKRSSKDDSSKSSFEGLLGRASTEKTKEQHEDKTSHKPESNPRKEARSTSPENAKSEKRTDAKDVGAEDLGGPALPSSTAPAIPATPVNDRLAYAQNVTMNPLAKVQPAPTKDDGVDSLTRRAVWTDFLRKMKDDLGVGAEDMMDAFASLSPEDLAKPPEQTVDKVVMALGLQDQQAQLARQYLNDLIHKTQSKSLGEELNASQKQISLTLMSQRELDRKALERSLEAMNRNFFKSQALSHPAKLQNAPPDRSIDAQSVEPQASEDDGQILKDSIAAFMASRKDESAPATSTPESAPNMSEPQSMSTQHAIDPKEASKINKLVEKLQAAEKGKSKDTDDAQIDQLIQKFVAPQAAMKNHSNQAPVVQNAQAQQAQVMPDAAANVKTPPTAALNIPANVLKGILNGDHGQNDDATGGDSDANADASHIGSILNSDTRTQGLSAKSGDFQSQMTQNHQGPQPMTVPDLVKQAQIMVRAGGGEMKVTMHPEGLGEVAMRVTVEKGKVGVQMITESDEAKKLIERQLGDLKASLSNSHLHLDTVKVDTATNLGKQLEQQYHDAQRQQAHMQWEQFRQNQPGGGWKQSFFDINSIRQAYQSDSQAPRDAKAPAATRARSLGSRRLDLVA